MTAAALKPNMFDHLFASRPDGLDSSSFTATALSVAFHATIVAVAIWASTALTPEPATRIGNEEIPIVIATQAPAAPVPSAPSQPSQPSQPANPSQPVLFAPTTIPTDIPAIDPAAPPLAPDFNTDAPVGNGTPGTPGAPAGTGEGSEPDTRGGFLVLSTMPALLNAKEISFQLANRYPPLLRDAGIGGRANVWVLIDENGKVERAEIKESSGHAALDEAALKVAPLMRFSPAMNRDQRVKVWASVPVAFRSR